MRADWLFLLTDVPCLYTANPATNPGAQPIHTVHDIAALQARSPPLLLHSPVQGSGGRATLAWLCIRRQPWP